MAISNYEEEMRVMRVECEVAKRLADKALDMAMEALVELKAMKQSTHKVEYVNPFADEIKNMADPIQEEPAPAMTEQRLSPFGILSGFNARRESLAKPDSTVNTVPDEEADVFWDEGAKDQ